MDFGFILEFPDIALGNVEYGTGNISEDNAISPMILLPDPPDPPQKT